MSCHSKNFLRTCLRCECFFVNLNFIVIIIILHLSLYLRLRFNLKFVLKKFCEYTVMLPELLPFCEGKFFDISSISLTHISDPKRCFNYYWRKCFYFLQQEIFLELKQVSLRLGEFFYACRFSIKCLRSKKMFQLLQKKMFLFTPTGNLFGTKMSVTMMVKFLMLVASQWNVSARKRCCNY